MEERLQKLLSAGGVCSRRASEALITAGRVLINGVPAVLGQRADPERDEIRVDGQLLNHPEKTVCLMLNKPRGYVTTMSDEQGRPTVADLVQDAGTRLYPIGRLDLDSEGLLLMTNDGALTQRLLHPSHEVSKTYHVWVYGPVNGAVEKLAALRDLRGEPIHPAQVSLIRQTAQTAELFITIHEGKNRQIRRMCARCGLSVKRLRREREHTLALGELPLGKWRYLTGAEIEKLKEE